MNSQLDSSIKPRVRLFSAGLNFISRQQQDWKVTVVRTSLDKFSYQMLFPYLSIYIVALGATGTQLGLVNSIGMISAGAISLLVGWLIDRTGPKKIYLFGISMLAISYFIFAVATGWKIIVIAMISYWLGDTISKQSCATVCGNCLQNQDRATGMTICETVAAGILGMAGPMLAAWIIMKFGGVNKEGIRPLFYIALAISVGTLFLVFARLSNQKWSVGTDTRQNFFSSFYSIIHQGRYLKRWLLLSAIGNLPLGMIFPFSQVFANEVKDADGLVLGAMVTCASLTSIVLAIPLGRLADRIGRKKVLYLTMPLFWVSNLMLIWATGPFMLIMAGALQGFFWIGAPIGAAMEREMVTADRMGRWLAIIRCFRMLLIAVMALLAGMIWDKIGPQYVFIAFIGLELGIRLPLLVSVPETLNSNLQNKTSNYEAIEDSEA